MYEMLLQTIFTLRSSKLFQRNFLKWQNLEFSILSFALLYVAIGQRKRDVRIDFCYVRRKKNQFNWTYLLITILILVLLYSDIRCLPKSYTWIDARMRTIISKILCSLIHIVYVQSIYIFEMHLNLTMDHFENDGKMFEVELISNISLKYLLLADACVIIPTKHWTIFL